MPHADVMKKFRQEVIKLCESFGGTSIFSRGVEASRVGKWCSVSKGGPPGEWTFLFLMRWIYAAMDLSECSHMYMVR